MTNLPLQQDFELLRTIVDKEKATKVLLTGYTQARRCKVRHDRPCTCKAAAADVYQKASEYASNLNHL